MTELKTLLSYGTVNDLERILGVINFWPDKEMPIPYSRDFVFPVDYDILVRGGKSHG